LWSNFLFWAKNKESFYRLEKEEKMWTNVVKIVCIFNDFFLTFFFSSVIIYYRMLSRGS
jgi:restriction endonuclease S subunit